MKDTIAVVGIGLRYPDANGPDQLWQNIMSRRRAFRPIPAERLSSDYYAADPTAPDSHYARMAAVLEGFEFNRADFTVSGPTFRSTDMTHWLALTVAKETVEHAGGVHGLPPTRMGVVLGNSLTGEFARANLMRMRWPYVRKVVAATLAERGVEDAWLAEVLRDLEHSYKSPFPAADADTLAGGLSNTIAGRICNHLDWGGGGFTVDGACSSSLLAVATAATGLIDRQLDFALAGGVDMSIDPFELIGFAKTSALTAGEMKIYDRASSGFWPGEGCGMVALMREDDALSEGRPIYATITGWGISSDGKGGLTRPEASGHRRAIDAAYGRAGYSVGSVGYFEGHGTGTLVGDVTEITAIGGALSQDGAGPMAMLGSIKGNIGHTKAAAGVAGLIKACLVLHHGAIPPMTGHDEPHPVLKDHAGYLTVPTEAVHDWPKPGPARAGVSSMGFGGINTHVALEAPSTRIWRSSAGHVPGRRQDCELLLFSGQDHADLLEQVETARDLSARLSMAELGDVAAQLTQTRRGAWRAAAVVSGPFDAMSRLADLAKVVAAGRETVSAARGVFFHPPGTAARIAFAFPGQGTGKAVPGAFFRRFPEASAGPGAAATEAAGSAAAGDGTRAGTGVETEHLQPRVAAASWAALDVLRNFGVEASVTFGHSLGELVALAWAGAVPAADLVPLAAARGRVMAEFGKPGGAMAGIAAPAEEVEPWARAHDVCIAAYNTPRRTVVSGPAERVQAVVDAATRQGTQAARLDVSHAFHSPDLRAAAEEFDRVLAGREFGSLDGTVVSTVTGAPLAGDDLHAHLVRQITDPVRFVDAAGHVARQADLVVEVGPGTALTTLLGEFDGGPAAVSVNTAAGTLRPFLDALAAAYAMGVNVRASRLYADRVVRPRPLSAPLSFVANPCETVPDVRLPDLADLPGLPAPAAGPEGGDGTGAVTSEGTLDFLLKAVAAKLELPESAVTAVTRPVDDLHLSSITVGQIANEVTKALELPPLQQTTGLATITLGELAEAIEASEQAPRAAATELPAGVANWVRTFAVREQDAPVPGRRPEPPASPGTWVTLHDAGHAAAAEALARQLSAHLPAGVLLVCGPGDDDALLGLLLEAGQRAVAQEEGGRLVVVQSGEVAGAIAKTVHLENPGVRVTVITVAGEVDAGLAGSVVTDVAATTSYLEVRHSAAGRTEPVLVPLTLPAPGSHAPLLTADDVVVASGGGKSITFECALDAAVEFGCALGLLGRSAPEDDADLAANLDRARAAGVRFRYERCDITDAGSTRDAVRRLEEGLGRVTAVIHGAGRNNPTALPQLDLEELRATDRPKAGGLRNLVAALAAPPRVVISFGSIIGAAGLRGEAHYALANQRLTTAALGLASESVRVLALEWSVWSGTGMGERLGVIEALQRDGVTPISVEQGVSTFRELVRRGVEGRYVVSGRTGPRWATLRYATGDLPLRRFTDRIRTHVPGVEIVAEAELTEQSDLYLADHAWDGNMLFPAVMAMEAMVQVGSALVDRSGPDGDALAGPPAVRDARFLRPIVVPGGGTTTLRVAALVAQPEESATPSVDVVLTSSETGFATEHMRATLVWGAREAAPEPLDVTALNASLELAGEESPYARVMFQGRLFQRVTGYRAVHAREVVADLRPHETQSWFGPLQPGDLAYSDPATQDAVMHSLQACIPNATLLPEGVDAVHHHQGAPPPGEPLMVRARERSEVDGLFTYDATVHRADGSVWQEWRGLRLRGVRRQPIPALTLPAPFVASLIERRYPAGAVTAVFARDGDGGPAAPRRARTAATAARVGVNGNLRYRPDGKPELADGAISVSHVADHTLVALGAAVAGVDVETVQARSWDTLLPRASKALSALLRAEAGDDEDAANTRLWTAVECLRKAGDPSSDLTLDGVGPDGWVTLRAGDRRISTARATVSGPVGHCVIGVLLRD